MQARTVPIALTGTLSLLILALAACGPPAEDPLEQQMQEAFQRTMTPGLVAIGNYRMGSQRVAFPLTNRAQVAGYLAVGDHVSNYTGWVKGENPSVIAESVSMGDYGTGRNTYYYANSLLTYYRSDQTLLDISDPLQPRRRLIIIEAGFTPLGELSAFRKLVDGEEVQLEANEAGAILARADLLSDSLIVAFRRGN